MNTDSNGFEITPSVWLRWASPLVLATASAVLYLNWDRIPDRWAIHWGVHGRPDGWAVKSPFWVFVPMLFGLTLWLVMEIAATITAASIRRNAKLHPAAQAVLTVVNVDFIHIVALGIAFMTGGMAVWLPLYPPETSGAVVSYALGTVIGSIVFGMVRAMKLVRYLKHRGVPGLEGWNGVIYQNPNDPRLMVPKISGLGYTFNFAHPWAWPLLILILAVPIAIALTVVFLAK